MTTLCFAYRWGKWPGNPRAASLKEVAKFIFYVKKYLGLKLLGQKGNSINERVLFRVFL
jgi:hypothetical protein